MAEMMRVPCSRCGEDLIFGGNVIPNGGEVTHIRCPQPVPSSYEEMEPSLSYRCALWTAAIVFSFAFFALGAAFFAWMAMLLLGFSGLSVSFWPAGLVIGSGLMVLAEAWFLASALKSSP
jgi:hypothetical protein